jgi:23S rRNA (uridine2552-2'-O)-methyltransferase
MADYKKPDFWQLKAKKDGYPARSVYKLEEMDNKFGLLKKLKIDNIKILDLGAAPGSWSLYVLRKIKSKGLLVSVDLSPISREYDKGLFDNLNFHFIQGDITAEEVTQKIQQFGFFTLLICDAAPSTTGNRSIDTSRSLELGEAVLRYAQLSLAKGADMVIKVFQGGESSVLLKQIKEMFNEGKSFKPQACRSESFETYYLGIGKR